MAVAESVPDEVVVPTDAGLSASSRSRIVAGSLLIGLMIAVVWSFEFVDQTIGNNVASGLLGRDAQQSAITGSVAGALFAFVSGLAGSFTACNVAAFSAVAPLVGRQPSARRRLVAALQPLGWLAAGMIAVSATYGAAGVVLGDRLPQLSAATTAAGMPVRLVQSTVVFGLIGLTFVYLGLAAVGAVSDPLARIRRRFAAVDMVVIGGLIGAFLIGRPFGLFFKMFQYASQQHNPLYGAGTFALQSLGNIVILSVLFLALLFGTRGRLFAWIVETPGRRARITGSAFMIAGGFTFAYWVLRIPATFGYGWFLRMPWS